MPFAQNIRLPRLPAETVQQTTIGVACNRIADRQVVPRIRKILEGPPRPAWSQLVREVAQLQPREDRLFVTAAEALEWLQAEPRQRLLIGCDSPGSGWLTPGALGGAEGEVIVAVSSKAAATHLALRPASPLRCGNLTVGVELGEPIRKAVQRLRLRSIGSARVIESEAELDQYLRLRFTVWNAHSYIAPARAPKVYQAEIDFTDRTAVPVGFFSNRGELIGCARLVKEMGNEEPRYIRLLQQIVDRSRDPVVAKNFRLPQRLTHPFDILHEFQGFQQYYTGLIKARIATGEVSRVAVLPAFERQGIAEALVDCVLDLAAQLRLRKLLLACPETHTKLYGRSEFRVVPGIRSDKFLDIAQPSVVMERDVSND